MEGRLPLPPTSELKTTIDINQPDLLEGWIWLPWKLPGPNSFILSVSEGSIPGKDGRSSVNTLEALLQFNSCPKSPSSRSQQELTAGSAEAHSNTSLSHTSLADSTDTSQRTTGGSAGPAASGRARHSGTSTADSPRKTNSYYSAAGITTWTFHSRRVTNRWLRRGVCWELYDFPTPQ